jgi:hypothetical protein
MMFALLSLALLASAPVQSNAADAANAAPKAKKVCHRIEVTGSNLPKLECHTAAEWKQIDDSQRPDISDLEHTQPR